MKVLILPQHNFVKYKILTFNLFSWNLYEFEVLAFEIRSLEKFLKEDLTQEKNFSTSFILFFHGASNSSLINFHLLKTFSNELKALK